MYVYTLTYVIAKPHKIAYISKGAELIYSGVRGVDDNSIIYQQNFANSNLCF